MVEQFVKRKGRSEVQATGFSFQLRCEDHFEGDVEHHVRAARDISRPMELKDYINTRLVGVY